MESEEENIMERNGKCDNGTEAESEMKKLKPGNDSIPSVAADGDQKEKEPSLALTASATGNPRNKVALKPGHSLMDWIRLGHSGKDLTGVNGKILSVTPEELIKHNTREDAWTCLRGKVYNITAYLDFHPGGVEELMKGAGKDCTDLFNNIHMWVNAESMLQKCLVGHLNVSPLTAITHPIVKALRRESLKTSPPPFEITSNNKVFVLPAPVSSDKPLFKWSQTESTVSLSIVTIFSTLDRESIISFCQNGCFTALIHIRDKVFYISLEFSYETSDSYQVESKNDKNGTTVDFIFQKATLGYTWDRVGSYNMQLHEKFLNNKNRDFQYVKCCLRQKLPVTHDTRLFKIELPQGCRMIVPVGHHIHIRVNISDTNIVRSYTSVPSSLLNGNIQTDEQFLYLMIKIYDTGGLTSHIDKLNIGDTIEVSDFAGNYNKGVLSSVTDLVLLAAGTGLTPMIGLIVEAFKSDVIGNVKLLFFNKKLRDILWKNALDEFSEKEPRFSVQYVLSNPDDGWQGSIGRVRRTLLEHFIPSLSGPELHICVCGPTGFTNQTLRILDELGYQLSQIHAFTS